MENQLFVVKVVWQIRIPMIFETYWNSWRLQISYWDIDECRLLWLSPFWPIIWTGARCTCSLSWSNRRWIKCGSRCHIYPRSLERFNSCIFELDEKNISSPTSWSFIVIQSAATTLVNQLFSMIFSLPTWYIVKYSHHSCNVTCLLLLKTSDMSCSSSLHGVDHKTPWSIDVQHSHRHTRCISYPAVMRVPSGVALVRLHFMCTTVAAGPQMAIVLF